MNHHLCSSVHAFWPPSAVCTNTFLYHETKSAQRHLWYQCIKICFSITLFVLQIMYIVNLQTVRPRYNVILAYCPRNSVNRNVPLCIIPIYLRPRYSATLGIRVSSETVYIYINTYQTQIQLYCLSTVFCGDMLIVAVKRNNIQGISDDRLMGAKCWWRSTGV
jgi:hypothetical protein